MRQMTLATFVLLATLAAGCGSGRVSVAGTVTYEDGTPVESGLMIAEGTIDGKLEQVQATIQKDGSFRWGGAKEGDGALPGAYKVILMPESISDFDASQGKTANIGSRYSKYESSGLSFEVKAGKNEYNIKIEKPKPKTSK